MVARLSGGIAPDAGNLRHPVLLFPAGTLALAFLSIGETLSDRLHPSAQISTRRLPLLVTVLALAAMLMPFGSVAATLLEVERSGAIPGFHSSELRRYIAFHMNEARLGDWRFEAARTSDTPPPNRVEWSFKLNAYAGGEVRSFARQPTDQRIVGVHRPITIEVRLYLNGEYQTLVSGQAVVEGGPDDPELAAVVENLTRTLLSPTGAYRSIDTPQRPRYPLR